jgi:hypothetical protein
VKVVELLESDLTDMVGIMLLMKHGKLDRTKATELAKELRERHIIVGNKPVPANLRWVEDKKTGTLRMVSADIPGSWRSGPSAMGRHSICNLLFKSGFSVSRFPSLAAKRDAGYHHNGPHIYFWGPGTPPPETEPPK